MVTEIWILETWLFGKIESGMEIPDDNDDDDDELWIVTLTRKAHWICV
jgi:hypothetical protein